MSFRIRDYFGDFQTEEKNLLRLGGGLFILMNVFVLLAYVFQRHLIFHFISVPENFEEILPIFQEKYNYRTIPFYAEVYSQFIMYSVSPFLIHHWTILLFIACVILGWSFLLTASTRMKMIPSVILQALFMIFVVLFGWKTSGRYILYFTFIAVLGTALLFRFGYLNLKMHLRFGVFVVLLAGIFGYVYYENGITYLFNGIIFNFPLWAGLCFLYLIAISPGFINGILFLSSARKKTERRFSFMTFFTVSGIFLLIIIFSVLVLYDIIPLNKKFIPAIPLFVLVSSVSFLLIQNGYEPLEKFFSSRQNYIYTFLGITVLSLAFVGFLLSAGDDSFLIYFNKIFFLSSAAVGFSFWFHLVFNFSARIQAKEKVFYFVHQASRIRYGFFWTFGIFLVVLINFPDNWTIVQYCRASYFNLNGDSEKLSGNNNGAIAFYGYAQSHDEKSFKANYNLGYLYGTFHNYPEAIGYLKKASELSYGEYAYLNLAHLYENYQVPELAKQTYLSAIRENKADDKLMNNLALFYYRAGENDSVIFYLKKAIDSNYHNADLYANLALLYLQNNKANDAKNILQAGLRVNKNSSALNMNTVYYDFKYNQNLQPRKFSVPDSTIFLDNYFYFHNYFMKNLRDGNHENLKKLLQRYKSDNETNIQFAYLNAVQKFYSGKRAESMDALQYLVKIPNYKNAVRCHMLGFFLWKMDAPEMASLYFGEASQLQPSNSYDAFLKGAMLIDSENPNRAESELSQLRIQNPDSLDAVNRELALLQYAFGDELTAHFYWDFSGITRDEFIRVGKYAGLLAKNIPLALDIYRKALERDSSDIVPYLEMAKIYLRAGDEFMTQNTIEAGQDMLKKKKSKEDPAFIGASEKELNKIQIDLWIHKNEIAGAEKLLSSMLKADTSDYSLLKRKAVIENKKNNTEQAISLCKKLLSLNPYDKDLYFILGEIYEQKENWTDGYKLFYDATSLNNMNAKLWLRYAFFADKIHQHDDVDIAVHRVYELADDDSTREMTKKSFSSVFQSK